MSRTVQLSGLTQGIQRIREKGGADPDTLYDLENGYVTIDGGVRQRPGTVQDAVLPAGTLGLMAWNNKLTVFSTTVKTVPVGYQCEVIVHPFFPSIGLDYIWFNAPFLGFPYVVAEFANGDIYHYWLQAQNSWEASTMYREGQIIVPSTPNGLGYKATRLLPADPLWAPGMDISVGDRVEPTSPNGYYYQSVGLGSATGVGTPGGSPNPDGGDGDDPVGDGAPPILPTVSEPSGFNADMAPGSGFNGFEMSVIGNIPDMYVGVPVVLNLVNGFDPFRVAGGWSPDRYAGGTIVPGVQPYNFAGSYPQIVGAPTTAGTYTTDLKVRDKTVAQSVTVLAKPTYSLPDWSTRKLLDSLTYTETTPPLTTARVTSYAESQYSPSPGMRSLGTFTTGKIKAEFVTTMQAKLGVTTRDDLLDEALTVVLHSLPAGTYAIEVDATVSPATYKIMNPALAILHSGSITLPAGKVFRFLWTPEAKGTVKANYGNEAWAVAASVGYAGLPMPAATSYKWKWDAASSSPVQAFALSDPFGNGIPTRIYSYLPFDNFIRGDVSHGPGKHRFCMSVITSGDTQRTGMCVAGFNRSAGMLGQAGTADSIGWRAPANNERAYRIEWCFGGVHQQILIDDMLSPGLKHEVLFAYDATAATVMILARYVPASGINVPAFTLQHTIPNVPAGPWFPAVTGRFGCNADAQYDMSAASTTSTYDPWSRTL